jgi:hypothetical protein
MRTAKEFEDDISDLLDVFFSGFDQAAIRTRKSLKYRSESGFRNYSPLIDVTVGPFSEVRGVSLWRDYDRCVNFSRNLINDLVGQFRNNYQDFGQGYFGPQERVLPNGYEDFLSSSRDVNWNARCFLAIEVEDSGSRKHLLGDMINASISGRIGVLVGYNEDKHQAFLRHLEYLAYTVRAGKIKFSSRNILVLKPDQLEKALIDNLEERPNNLHLEGV